MPAELPAALRDRVVVVRTIDAVDAILHLAGECRSVTLIKPTSTCLPALRGPTNVTILHGTEIVCVDGIEQLECVVVRKIRTGAISAIEASALFLLQ